MKLEKRQPTGREKDEESIQLLEQLREQLYSSNISTVRQSAFRLSWMQEDGLEILREALLGDTPRRAKSAAAYGLRKMRGPDAQNGRGDVGGRLARHEDRGTAEISRNALVVLKKGKTAPKRPSRPERPKGKPGGRPPGKFEIREIPGRDRARRQPQRGRRPDDQRPSRRR
jgi:hypothetical protein